VPTLGVRRDAHIKTRWVETPDRGTTADNAAALLALLQRDLPEVDTALIAGFSKGSADTLEFLRDRADELPPAQRAKLRAFVSFAGVLRGSCVADWAAHDHDAAAIAFRSLLNVRGGHWGASFADLDSISRDPWQSASPPRLRKYAPNLHCISYVSLPEGKDGMTALNPMFAATARCCEDTRRRPGPCDGLVETAAAALPPDCGAPQWIVRVKGSHAVLDGSYLDGTPVAPGYSEELARRIAGGSHLLDSFLRAMPKAVLGW
jgi:hypothetical protein